jgi:transposase
LFNGDFPFCSDLIRCVLDRVEERVMGVAIGVTRLDYSSAELRSLARNEAGAVACRILAIAHVLDGASRAEAAASCGMDRQTLRDWVHRFSAEGIGGLANKAILGRSPALSEGQMAHLREIVLAGPDLARDGVVRWRCCDLQKVIAERFGVAVHERTVGKLLRRLRLTRLQPRPHNPKWDEAAQEVFKKTFRPS